MHGAGFRYRRLGTIRNQLPAQRENRAPDAPKILGWPSRRLSGLRDRPDLNGTSQLSSHLHFGEISPRQIWHETRNHLAPRQEKKLACRNEAFLRQIVWREFAYHLLFHFPETDAQAPASGIRKLPLEKKQKSIGGVAKWADRISACRRRNA